MFRWSRLWRPALAGAAAVAAVTALAAAGPAAAEPATTVNYPARASATRYTGPAFDTCTAPSLATMQAWTASPYRAIGVYIGGQSRTCSQPELTGSWVGEVSALGWRLIPIFKGRQPPCGTAEPKIIPAAAASEGTWAAGRASELAMALGMIKGSAIYYDMENYPLGITSCRNAVLTFLSAWTSELHRLGYVSGVYENLNLGAGDLANVYQSAAYARPDALWVAHYDLDQALTGWAGIDDSLWAVHQRGKQFHANFSATYGGVQMTIDADNFDAPVATTAFGYLVTGGAEVAARTGPARSYPKVTTYPAGAGVTVVCQAPGSAFGTSSVWDKLIDGSYVPDSRVDTPSEDGYSTPVTRCRYPYQVTPTGGANLRGGPGTSFSVTGRLPGGSLAWVICQQAGAPVGSTLVWDKISYWHWVSDSFVATPNPTGFSRPAPRC